jgi:MOSC domain-containing protein YiiM
MDVDVGMEDHSSFEQLEIARAALAPPPRERGAVDLIVQRPTTGERALPEVAQLSVEEGFVGDRWYADPEREVERQLTLMNTDYAGLVSSRARRPLLGDNFLVDFDLSEHSCPPGSRLRIGESLIEVTATPHLGCQKFKDRFGPGALRWVNVKSLLPLTLRGVNARVIEGGQIRVGDAIVLG